MGTRSIIRIAVCIGIVVGVVVVVVLLRGRESGPGDGGGAQPSEVEAPETAKARVTPDGEHQMKTPKAETVPSASCTRYRST